MSHCCRFATASTQRLRRSSARNRNKQAIESERKPIVCNERKPEITKIGFPRDLISHIGQLITVRIRPIRRASRSRRNLATVHSAGQMQPHQDIALTVHIGCKQETCHLFMFSCQSNKRYEAHDSVSLRLHSIIM
jgi:hypothetical protein